MKTTVSMLLSLPLLLPLVPLGSGEATTAAPSHRTTGTTALALPLSSVERTDLAAAEQASMDELMDIRGGQADNSTLWTILLVLGIIVLVLLIV